MPQGLVIAQNERNPNKIKGTIKYKQVSCQIIVAMFTQQDL